MDLFGLKDYLVHKEYDRRYLQRVIVTDMSHINVAKGCLRSDNAAAANYDAISGPTKRTVRLFEQMHPENSYLSFHCAG